VILGGAVYPSYSVDEPLLISFFIAKMFVWGIQPEIKGIPQDFKYPLNRYAFVFNPVLVKE
jgi:hypothetical protein